MNKVSWGEKETGMKGSLQVSDLDNNNKDLSEMTKKDQFCQREARLL